MHRARLPCIRPRMATHRCPESLGPPLAALLLPGGPPTQAVFCVWSNCHRPLDVCVVCLTYVLLPAHLVRGVSTPEAPQVCTPPAT